MANKVYTEKADVYSIGVILWELLTRSTIFAEVRFMNLLEDMVPLPFRCGAKQEWLTDDYQGESGQATTNSRRLHSVLSTAH